jgi:putative hydrolase of the HAD superfamily
MTTTPVRAVILDYGQVLSRRPGPAALGPMATLFGIAPASFLEAYGRGRGPYDQGLVTAEEYWRGFAGEAGVSIDAAQLARLRRWDVEAWSEIDGAMIDWLAGLRPAGLITALLSNMPVDMAAHARASFAWLAHFDHLVLSCEARLIKPDPALFRRCLAVVGVHPAEALFVDDREENVAAARAEGMRAIQFHSTAQLRRELASLGFAPLPGRLPDAAAGAG